MSFPSSGYIPSLDGLRAVSILIVFVSHAGLGHLVPGGFGVTVFFFISGFLITVLLCREFDRFGKISFKAFYVRRALRLMPPLFIALGTATALVVLGFINVKLDTPTLAAQVLFLSNYYQIYGNSQSIPGLGVLWSLAVEEHFYLIWPMVFLMVARQRIGLRLLAVAAVAFLAWRIIRYSLLGTSDTAIYYLSDTRLDSLLYGCLLALMMWRGVLPIFNYSAPSLLARNALIAIAIIGILATFVIRDDTFRSTWRYSIQGLALMPIFFFAVTHPNALLFRPLNWRFVRFLGVLSYSIYLVHNVILQMLFERLSGGEETVWAAMLAAGMSVGYAALVYRSVDLPSIRIRELLTGHPKRTSTDGVATL